MALLNNNNNNNNNKRCKNFVLGRDKSYFVKNHSDSTKNWYHQNPWVCYVCLGFFFNRQPAFIRVLTVFPFSPTCSFIRTNQTSYRGFYRKNEKKLARSLNSTFRYINDILSINNSKLCDFYWSHLSHWACNNGYHRYIYVCFIPSPIQYNLTVRTH